VSPVVFQAIQLGWALAIAGFAWQQCEEDAYLFQVIEQCFRQAPASTTAASDVDPKLRDLDHEQPYEEALGRTGVQAMDDPVEEMVMVEEMLFVEVDGKLQPVRGLASLVGAESRRRTHR